MFAKKNVVAAAVLTLLAVTAQAQVSVYGQLDVSVGRKQVLTGTATGTKLNKAGSTNVDSSDMSQSYLGFKGQEDLGNGLKAVFKLESDLAVDTGATTAGAFWSRNATVGLVGDFGALNLGRFENLTKLEGAAFNPFGASGTFSPTMRRAVDTESWSNGISYVSPNLSGLTLSAQYSAKEAASAADGTRAYAASANYTAGPLAFSVVYSDIKSIDTAVTDKDRAWLLGASYDLGMAKLYAQYGRGKITVSDDTGSEKSNFFQVGAAIPVGADGTVLMSLAQGKDKESGRAGTEGSNKDRDFSLGYTHKLSKRTNVYAALINERTTKGLNQAPDLKATTNSVAVGVRHAF